MSQQINLFNPVFLKQKKQFSALTLAQGLCIILLGGIAVAAYARLQTESMRQRQAELGLQLAQTQAQLARVMAEYPPRVKDPALQTEVAKAEAALSGLRHMFDTVRRGGLGNDQGYAAYFAAFSRQIVGDLWLTGFRIAGPGSDIELRGRTLRPELVPVYLNRLKQEPVLRGKTFATLAMNTPVSPAAEAPAGTASADAAGNAKPGQKAPYVEFVLRSSGFEREADAKLPDGKTAADKSGNAAAAIPGLPAALNDALGGRPK